MSSDIRALGRWKFYRVLSTSEVSGCPPTNALLDRQQKAKLILCGAMAVLPILRLMSRLIADEWEVFQVFAEGYACLSWLFCLFLASYEFSRGFVHNYVIRSWFLLEYLGQCLSLQRESAKLDNVVEKGPEFETVTYVFAFLFNVVLAIMGLWFNKGNSSAYKPLLEDNSVAVVDEDAPEAGQLTKKDLTKSYGSGAKKVAPPNPADKANIFSIMAFGWVSDLLKTGFQRPLEDSDVWELRNSDRVEHVYKKFEKCWNEEKRKLKPSLGKAFWATFGYDFVIAGIFKFLQDLLGFFGPVLLNLIIKFVQDTDKPLAEGIGYAFAMFGAAVFQTVCVNLYFYRVYNIGMQLRSVVIEAVYLKSVKLSNKARQKSTTGEIVNHQSIDAQRFSNLLPYLHMVWSAPLQIGISMYMLWTILEASVLGGVAIMILLIPLNIYMARKQGAAQKAMLGSKDKRMKITSEVLNGVRVMKFFGWEESFAGRIAGARAEEVTTLKTSAYIRSISSFFFTTTPMLVATVSFALFSALGGLLVADKTFPALALFNILRFPLNMLPMVIGGIVEARISLKRIENFLLHEELDSNAVIRSTTDTSTAISIHNGEFSWTETGTPTLSDLNLMIPKGKLVAVVGPVGCGKSSLVSALLGEIKKNKGTVYVNGSVAYVPQAPWMQNATLKNNIVFGKPLDEEKYQRCVGACELTSDLAMLPSGDRTEIGEKGINLSGGQKQRVSCARAMYQDADIYLLDSPLSAVDAHVGKAMFQNFILGALRNKTRVLVTHQLHFLPYTDMVVIVRDGRIVESGTYEQLMQGSREFSELMNTHVGGAASKDDTEEPTPDKKKPEAAKKDDKKDSKIIVQEEKGVGSVGWHIYARYINAIGVIFAAMLVLLFASDTGSKVAADWWLSHWSDASDKTTDDSLNYYLLIYIALGAGQAIIVLTRSLMLALSSLGAANRLHDGMLRKVLHAPMSFFDTTPLGRILNRFAKDQNAVDETLPVAMGMFAGTGMSVLSIMIVISTITPFFLIVLLPLVYLYYYIQQYYLSSSRELQRLDSISKSPIYAQFSETLNGMSTIRAFGAVGMFARENERKVDQNNRAFFANQSANRWLSCRLEFVCASVVFVSAFFAVVERENIDPGLAGLSLTYALNLTGVLNWLIRQSAEVETQLVAVERVVEYTELKEEGPYELPPHMPAPEWPSRGAIEFRDFKMRYREGMDLVLKGIDVKIQPKHKVGIVGRTGAGKSSVVLALFRMVEAAEGAIFVDGIDISAIGLNDLRGHLSIIPQDPVLFTGTIRSNLDPFNKYNDADLWKVLDSIYMKTAVEKMPLKLESPVTENGENLSVGQRQLMCLGRALLRKAKILIMDEATAAVDFETDNLIQQTIRKEFKDITVLTIAHRINTIIDSDRVMVLDQGKVAEYDSPENLLNDRNSIFYSLVNESRKT